MPAPVDGHYWFVRKRFGYGATPATWQGWLSVLAYVAIVAFFAWRLRSDTLRIAVLTPITLGYIWFVSTKTEGGFGWRWGK